MNQRLARDDKNMKDKTNAFKKRSNQIPAGYMLSIILCSSGNLGALQGCHKGQIAVIARGLSSSSQY